jgi:demethylmenaquinone methyltransferase/2-methoxy-6-polyprenyl-1,4-benzoquinol methylase
MKYHLSGRELAYCGLFGAASLLFPVVFHLVRLGHVFMPMYLPLVTLAFFVPPVPAAVTALIVPILSGAVTGMPPFYPPVAVFMSLELAVMAALIATVVTRRPKINEWLVLVTVLCFGRVLYVALVYAFSLAIALPAGFIAGLSLLGGWPGIVLMIVIVPPVARLRKRPRPDGRRAGGKQDQKSSLISNDAKAAYFNGIAKKWDGWEDLPALGAKLAAGLDDLGVGPNETILDLGCGTGNLTLALLAKLSPAGRIVAVDIALRMIEEARRKIRDQRVEWHVADVQHLPVPDSSFDRVFCFSVWPHIDDREAVALELGRVLKPGGFLHVWHLSSRGKINEVHVSTGGPIHHDFLPPASETATLLEKHGFRVTTAIDDADRYVVTAIREEHRGK